MFKNFSVLVLNETFRLAMVSFYITLHHFLSLTASINVIVNKTL